MNSPSFRQLAVSLLVLSLLAPTGIAASGPANDITYVEHDITEQTTWTPEGGPYRIAADVTIREGATLDIEPGTTVQPAEDITITVDGNLSADGTAANPITFETAPKAPTGIHWGTIQYNGTTQSHLSLSHVTLESAQTGVTMTSGDGSVDVQSATIRNVTRDGIRVTETTETPKFTVTDSTFANVGGRGIAITPGMGAVGESAVTSRSDGLGNRTIHNVTLSLAADTTAETLEFSYLGHGDVNGLSMESIHRLGIDTDDDGEIDRSILSQIRNVEHPRRNAFTVGLRDSVTIPADASLVASYTAVNPRTYGTYPVTVRLRNDGVEQLAETTLPLDISSADDRYRESLESETSRATRFEVVDSTFRGIEDQGVFVAATTTDHFEISGSEIVDVRGSGVTVRGRKVHAGDITRNQISKLGEGADGIQVVGQRVTDAQIRRNKISDSDAGISLTTRGDDIREVSVDSNTVANGTTGLRVFSPTSDYGDSRSLTVVNNNFSNNEKDGISVDAPETRLKAIDVRNNVVAENGRTGVFLGGRVLSQTTVRGNTIEANGKTGLRLDGGRVTHARVADNTISSNQKSGATIDSRQVRDSRIVANEFAENHGHGLAIHTSVVVHNVSLTENRVFDNAGIGLDLDNELTHAGTLNLTRNTIAANAYGVRIAGSLNARLSNNSVVYNTYAFDAPVRSDGYRTGTGIVVEDGAAGAIFRTGDIDDELADLLDDPEAETELRRQGDGEYSVVLRPDGASDIWKSDDTALTVRSISGDIPTGVTLPKDDDRRSGVVVRGNDVYGQHRGLVVNVTTLVDANTTTRLLVNTTQTVVAERNYWGNANGPTHSSIHPEGAGDRIVTRQGWVDFLPFADESFESRYARPTVNLTVNPNPVAVEERVELSATDFDGQISTYRFSVDGDSRVGTKSNATASFAENGTYTVSLAVEDELGIDSAGSVNRTITVNQPRNTTGAVEGQNATGSSAGNESNASDVSSASAAEAGLLVSESLPFSSVGGLLGLFFYGAGLALGALGTVQTFRSTPITVGGTTVNALAGVGVLVWIGSGLFGTDGLLTVGVGAAVLWGGLVAFLWLLTTRR